MTTDLTKGKPFKLIMLMSLPIMVGNLFQQLYSTVDAILVGRYLGSDALAAVGSTSSLYCMIMWFVCGVSGGFAIVLAQYFGAGDHDRLRRGVCIALELSIAITIVVTVGSLIFLRKFLVFMNTPEGIIEDAYIYLFVIVAGMMATMLYNMCAAILRAIGDSRTPFLFILVSSVTNVVLDIVMIRNLKMGVFGAALATIISQALSALLCVIYMYSHFEILRFGKADWKFDSKMARKMMTYGIPSGLCGVTTAIGILVLQVAINVYGTIIIAAFTAAIKVQNFVEVPFNAYSTTMVNYAGQNIGAGKVDHLHKGYVQCMMLALGTAVVFGIAAFFWGDVFAGTFVKDESAEEIIAFAAKYLKYAGAFFISFSILLVTRSTLQGLGFSSAPVIIGITESSLRVVATVYLLYHHNELALCLVNPIIWTIAAVVVILMYVGRMRKLRKKEIIKE